MKNFIRKFYAHLGLSMLLVSCVMPAMAQNGVVGIRFMPTVSSLEVKSSTGNEISADGKVGFGAGIFVGYGFNDFIGVQAEAIYSSLSQKYSELDREYSINLRYLSIPLLLSLNTGKSNLVNLNVVGGPQLGISAGSDLTFTNNPGTTAPNPVLSVKKGDLGFAYGAGLDFGLNTARSFRLGIGYRGVTGLFDISENSKTLVTNNYYLLDRSQLQTHAAFVGVSYLF